MKTTPISTKQPSLKTAEPKKRLSKVMQGIMKIQGAFDREEVIKYGHS